MPRVNIPSMPRKKACQIIAVVNQKGGVGKTTTAVNLACALAQDGKRTLLVDTDAQCNATDSSGFRSGAYNREIKATILDLLRHRAEFDVAVTETKFGYDLIAGSSGMSAADIGLWEQNESQRFFALRDCLKTVRARYDYCIIDCPPSAGLLTYNALAAADRVIIPVQCQYWAYESLKLILDTIKGEFANRLNPNLKIGGILLTMFDKRNSHDNMIAKKTQVNYPDLVFKTVIPKNVKTADATDAGMPVLVSAPKDAISAAYRNLAKEIISRH